MRKNFWCFIDMHRWIYSNDRNNFDKPVNYQADEIFRKCSRCEKKQQLTNYGQANGMASMEEWTTIY